MMPDHIQQAIRTLEQEMEALEDRRGELLKAIEALRPLAGVDARTRTSRHEKKFGPKPRAAKAGRTVKTTESQDAIVAALRAKSPQAPAALAKALKIARPALTYQLKPLLQSGAVVATGATMNRQFSLPGRAPKEVP